MKKKRNTIYQKSVSLLAAAAMTAVLMTGQVYPVLTYGQNITSEIEKSTIIPDNITIEEPVELSEVALPKSDYGVLSWVDDSYVPQKRVQSCEVVFKPAADVDLSYLSGWDSKKKVVKGKITVVVSSIEGSDEEEPVEDGSSVSELPASDEITGSEGTESGDLTGGAAEDPGNTEDTEDAKEDTPGSLAGESAEEVPSQDVKDPSITQAPSLTPSEAADASANEQESGSSSDVSSDQGEKEDTDLPTAGDILSSPSDEEAPSQDAAQDASLADAVTSEKENSDPEVSDPKKTDTEATAVEASDAAKEDTSDIVVEPGKLNEAFGSAMPGATVLDGEEESENGDSQSDEKTDPNPADESENTDNTDKNIFDNPQDFMVSTARPDTAEEDLTAEEQAVAASVNHNCEGIQVSGVDLPWYVQFQVTSGEAYEFKNEDKATIFQSFEFKLWDLKNNTEYEIPDGQYISVTIPVKEGYEYSIEHLLDNGATETIIPSVNGSTMVFSTHSFSPFGIAGFRPIVGDEIANGAYGDNGTPTPTPTVTISGTPTPSPSVTGTAGTNGTSGTSGNGTTGGQTNGNTNGTAGNNGTGGTGTSGNTNTGTGDAAPADGNPSNPTNNGTGGTTSYGTGSTSVNGSSQNGTSGTNAGSGTVSDGSGSNGTTAGNSGNSQNAAGNQNQSQTPGAVQTGDNTMIFPFVVLVVVAVLVIAAVLVIRRKKNQ